MVELRPATKEDCDLLFQWVNDPIVRMNAFNSATIRYDEHKSWYHKLLNSNSSKIFIATENGIAIGQIRVDSHENIGVIGYSVANEFRGRGYGTLILVHIVPLIKEEHIGLAKLIGKVKYSNLPSQKAFIKAGYIEKKEMNYIEYVKNLV